MNRWKQSSNYSNIIRIALLVLFCFLIVPGQVGAEETQRVEIKGGRNPRGYNTRPHSKQEAIDQGWLVDPNQIFEYTIDGEKNTS